MIYGLRTGETLIIAAADSLVELEAFYATAVCSRDMYVVETQPSLVDMMIDERMEKLKKPPYVFEFDSPVQLQRFTDKYGVETIKQNRLNNLHQAMLEALEADPYATRQEGDERKTIGMVHDLVNNDPWDHRTPEEIAAAKAQEEEYEKRYKEAKEKGRLTGGSFAPPKTEGSVSITDIRTTVDRATGKIEIDNVLGVKGLYDDTRKEALEAERRAAGLDVVVEVPEASNGGPMPIREIVDDPSEADDEDMSIDPNGAIAIYFRVEVAGAKLADIAPHLMGAGYPVEQLAAQRNNAAGCWIAVVRKSLAEKAVEILTESGFTAEETAVNDSGESLLPKGQGATVVDADAIEEEPPRPWNDRAWELAKMTPEELAANKKGYKAAEFIYCGRHTLDDGCIIHVAPRSWFAKNGTMYPDSLDIDHILPEHLKERFPGIYQTRSVDWNGLTAELSIRRKFTENMWLQLYLNSL